MIIATAGHVDHGKTALLKMLTEVNADRLPEEKRRGMTIDLGYAYLPLADPMVLGFIDVPGHEKFLTNMLAGVTGIQMALLVVAADDGVMPQTREHLLILFLLGIVSLIVVITKADKVDKDRIEEVKQQLRIELAHYHYQDIKFFVTSIKDASTVEPLRQYLTQLTIAFYQTATPYQDHRFRLAIDRAFLLKGSGLVVTGTALAGQVQVGETLWLTGREKTVRVRSLHAQNTPVQQAKAGERIALNITGDVNKEQIQRGDWLLSQQPVEAVSRALVTLYSWLPIKQWQPVHLHHAASHVTGRVSLLEDVKCSANQTLLAELIFDKPLYLVETDRILIRRIDAKETLGVACVVELTVPNRGKRQPQYLQQLQQLAQSETDEQNLKVRLQQEPLYWKQFAWNRQLSEEQVVAMISRADGLIIKEIALLSEQAKAWEQKILQTLADYHQQHSDQPGIARASLYRMVNPAMGTMLSGLLDNLLAEKKVLSQHGWLSLPGYRLAFNEKQKQLWQRISACFSGSEAVWVRDIAEKIGEDEKEVRAVMLQAAKLGLIIAIVKDRYYSADAIYSFAEILRLLQQKQGAIRAADFRDKLGCGRKLVIQLLEFFDVSGFTRRKKNEHFIRDDNLFKK